MCPVEGKAVAVFVHELWPVRVFLGVRVPHLHRIFHCRQHLVEQRVIRRMVEQAKFGLKRVGDDEDLTDCRDRR
jgi:hypothetical protein